MSHAIPATVRAKAATPPKPRVAERSPALARVLDALITRGIGTRWALMPSRVWGGSRPTWSERRIILRAAKELYAGNCVLNDLLAEIKRL